MAQSIFLHLKKRTIRIRAAEIAQVVFDSSHHDLFAHCLDHDLLAQVVFDSSPSTVSLPRMAQSIFLHLKKRTIRIRASEINTRQIRTAIV
jgi:hypothetical protein